LSVGVNLNPDRQCNFNCVYCEVNRDGPVRERQLDIKVLAGELRHLLRLTYDGRLRELEWFRHLPAELLQLLVEDPTATQKVVVSEVLPETPVTVSW